MPSSYAANVTAFHPARESDVAHHIRSKAVAENMQFVDFNA